MMRCIWRQM